MDDIKISLKEYYKTPHWINFSKKMLDDKECACQLCGRKRWVFQKRKKVWKRKYRFAVHHINYNHLYEENENCVILLCYTCHDMAHTLARYQNISPLYKQLYDVITAHGFSYTKEA